MLGQYAHELNIPTRGRAFYEITRDVDDHVAAAGFKTGLVTRIMAARPVDHSLLLFTPATMTSHDEPLALISRI